MGRAGEFPNRSALCMSRVGSPHSALQGVTRPGEQGLLGRGLLCPVS
jgi:hypothetical protein